jgi:protein O-mannosyl-transferase
MTKHKHIPKTSQAKTTTQPQQHPGQVKSPESPKARDNPKTFQPDNWLMLILVAVAFLINATTISYDYTLDDPFFTKENKMVNKGVASIPDFFTHAAYYGVFQHHDASYRPLLLTSFAVEKELVGFNPHVSHFVNLVLFCFQIIALFSLLRIVFKKYPAWLSFFIVLLFELHPIHTEVIASIKSRDEIMALLFTALCTLQSFKYIDSNKTKHLVLSGVYFFVALMCKETPITFVGIVPLSIYFFRNVQPRKIITACLPYAAVAALYMLMRMSFIENDSEKVRIMVNNNALMAATGYPDKLATALFIQLKYLILLVFPHPLSWDYSYNQIPIIGFGNVKAIAAVLIIGGMVVYAVANLRRKDIFSYCILFYAASVIITANIIVDIGATMAERFVYTASLAYCIALVFLLLRVFKVNLTQQAGGTSLPALFGSVDKKVLYVIAVIGVLYGAKTAARNPAWKDNLTLYETGVETAPDSWRTHNLLGVAYTKKLNSETDVAVKRELFSKAMEHFNRSLEILSTPDVWVLKGYAYEFIGKDDSAIYCYKMTLQLDKSDQKASFNLASVYLRNNLLDDAILLLQPIVDKNPGQVDAVTNLAAAYGNKGNFQEALKYYNMAMQINPDQPRNVLQSMTNIYRILGDSAKTKYYRSLMLKK